MFLLEQPYNEFSVMAMTEDWSWTGLQQMMVNPNGMTKVNITGTGNTIETLYEDAALKDIYITKALPDGVTGAMVTDGAWNVYLLLEIGDALGTTTDFTFTNGTYYHWGGFQGFSAENTTVNFGEKDAQGARGSGCTMFQIGWRARNQGFGDNWTVNMYDVTWCDTSNFIDAASLSTTTSLGDLAFGDDANFNWSGDVTLEAFRMRNVSKLRKQTVGTLSSDAVHTNGLDELETFYNGGDQGFGYNRWILENPDIGMPTAGNGQSGSFDNGVYYRKCTIVNPTTTDANIANAFNTFWIGNDITSTHSSDNFDISCKLNRTAWQSGGSTKIFQCVPIRVRVVDNTGTPISGATVTIFSNDSSTEALFVDTTSASFSRNDYILSTDANGDVVNGTNTQVDLVYQQWDPAGALTGEVTALMSEHVTAGALTNTVYSPFRMEVSKTGYKTFVGLYEFKQTEIIMEVGLDVPQTNTGPVLVVGIAP